MSSSSSDSDSDESEPIRRIKINIRPKEEVVRCGAADVDEIKASVEAWRPLGPPPHPSLSRRQSSLSSVSSMSFGTNSTYGGSNINSSSSSNANAVGSLAGTSFGGASSSGTTTTIHSSPSCSSLVNEFNNRSSFSNFMSNISRTSSPLTVVNHGDAVPIAIAIQESIELIIKGHYDPSAIEPKFNTRFMGNIKVAFPNAFAKGSYGKQSSPLKLRLHSSGSIIRYYASRLIKDLDLGTANTVKAEKSIDAFSQKNGTNSNSEKQQSINGFQMNFLNNQSSFDSLETSSSKTTTAQQFPTVDTRVESNSQKIIEFDMGSLMSQLKRMYDQSPISRYYNVDVLRYQIAPITSIEESPLQVCAYWKVEANLVKIRIDFKHSSKSGLSLERLREITFNVNLTDFVPSGIDVNPLSPHSLSKLKLNNNNNSGAMNMNYFETASGNNTLQPRHPVSLIDDDGIYNQPSGSMMGGINAQMNILSPLTNRNGGLLSGSSGRFNAFGSPSEPIQQFSVNNISNNNPQLTSTEPLTPANLKNMFNQSNHLKQTCNNPMPPFITYEPQAHWNNSIKQLTWKFDNLLSYRKTDGLGSLFAKLDFRSYQGMPSEFLKKCKPTPVDVKFLVIDSTLSKISLSIDSIGYKMSVLKKEIRSGRYRSEPYIL